MPCPKLFRLIATALAGAGALLSPRLQAYNLSGERWSNGQVTMHLQLHPTAGPLLDGATSFGAVAEDALAAWNRNLSSVTFVVVRNSPAAVSRGNGLNNVIFSSTVYGAAWGSRILGITLQTFDTRNRRYSETDVLFNDTVQWDSYRGPVRPAPGGGNLNDFRRVAMHEFGHALGLNHPDDIGQSVVALMNAFTSDVDSVAADDIAGARAIYENPNVVPTAILSLQGAAGYSTLGSSLTLRVGSVRNDGDVTSGPLRLELWAMPQPLSTSLPPGSFSLGISTLTATVAPSSALSDLNVTTTYTTPPNGSYFVALLLTEAPGAGGDTFALRDHLLFSTPLNVGPAAAPRITAPPVSVGATAGGTATFTVTAAGTLPLAYQWRRDGTTLPGATTPSLTLANVQAAQAGAYTVVVTNALGSVTSEPATLLLGTNADPGRIVNMSIRSNAGTGDRTLIVGVGLGGADTTGPKAVLFRAVGPTLAAFGVTGALADTVMTIFQGSTPFAQNDDWAGGFDFRAVGAFEFAGAPPRDSAFYSSAIASDTYSIQIAGKNNATGVALAEIYDSTPTAAYTRSTPRLVNVSARTEVGTGDNILIAGFVVGGTTPVRVLVRAVGPTLGAFGVGGTLADPRLEILRGTTRVAQNDDWLAADADTFGSVGAFPLNPGSRDAALVTTLVRGSYTVEISGVAGTTGVALVEVYELP